MSSSPRRNAATLCGLGAVALWSSMALLTTMAGAVPPFALTALAFALASAIGLLRCIASPAARAALRQPPRVWIAGVGGLFGFHALYFAALGLAPPAPAMLVCNTWPLVIVVGSDLMERGRPAATTLLGGAVAFGGIALLTAPGAGISARMGEVPTDSVTGFCLATAALSALAHVLFEAPAMPRGAVEWLVVAALGIGPVGAAFFLWDRGMKAGDVRLLGFASFAIPVLSTLLLVLAGRAEAGLPLAVACAMVAAGAAIARLRPSRASR
jgi:drug/metabolite transporter (DMT)-like permease